MITENNKQDTHRIIEKIQKELKKFINRSVKAKEYFELSKLALELS